MRRTLVCLLSFFNLEDDGRKYQFAFQNELTHLPPFEVTCIHHRIVSLSTLNGKVLRISIIPKHSFLLYFQFEFFWLHTIRFRKWFEERRISDHTFNSSHIMFSIIPQENLLSVCRFFFFNSALNPALTPKNELLGGKSFLSLKSCSAMSPETFLF